MKAWFISDLHLKTMEERNSQKLLRFLHLLAEQNHSGSPTLFLLGDIFDLWVSNHRLFIKKFLPIVQAIQNLRTKGFRVIYFEGNHDMHIDRFWTREMGVEVFDDAQTFSFDNFVIRAEHGDLINKQDLKNLRSRKILRHPFIEFLGHLLPGEFWQWLGGRASKKSRSRSSTYRIQNEDNIRAMIREHAKTSYDQAPFDLIVSGHMHVLDDFEFIDHGKKIRSINLGDWSGEAHILIFDQGQLNWEVLVEGAHEFRRR